MSNHLYLIDGSGFIFRAFHALPPLTRADGKPVNAVLGFVNMMIKLVEECHADHIAVIFDVSRKTFRNDIYPAYKAHRSEVPEELIPQFPLVREACHAFSVPALELVGYEADDLIATYAALAEKEGMHVTIVSSDKDLMQLIQGETRLYDPIKNQYIGPDEVKAKFGVLPERVKDVLAMAGDSSDNIPGIPGIGVKTAAELINLYGSLEEALGRAQEVKQPKRRHLLEHYADQARLSYKLVQLCDNVPVPQPLTQLKRGSLSLEPLFEFLTAQGFRSVLSRLQRKQQQTIQAGENYSLFPNLPSSSPSSLPAIPSTADSSFELITTDQALERWIAKLWQKGKGAVDTETTSLNTQQAELVGIALAVDAKEACYIPLSHNPSLSQAEAQLPLSSVLEKLAPFFQESGCLKVGHNLKYDMAVLDKYQITLKGIEDTMLMSYVLDNGRHGHGLDELAKVHFQYNTLKYEEVVERGKTFRDVPLELACRYAAEDAAITWKLYEHLKPRLSQEKVLSVYETFERPLIQVLVNMEKEGILIDPEALKSLSDLFAKNLKALEEEIYTLAKRPFNIASPKQLGEILFDELKIADGKRGGKTGGYITRADVLEDLASQGHILPQKTLEWRQLSKLKSTYADALIAQCNPHTQRVHTSFSMATTSTGRLASSDPNLQNVPIRTEWGKQIRNAFIAREGFFLVSFDYSQIELRLLAHVAQIPSLLEAFRSHADIHALTASQVFGIPLDKVSGDLRRKAKAINFGIIYGISSFGLGKQIGHSPKEAAHFMNLYFQQYPGIKEYMEKTIQEARSQGFVTTPWGRKCYITGLHDSNFVRRQAAERQAINAPLQGGAADIIKKAMIEVSNFIKKENIEAHLLLQVHDELLLEVKESSLEIAKRQIKSIMEKCVALSVPLEVDVSCSKNWQ